MRKAINISVILSIFTFSVYAQNDTLYIMKNGIVINKQAAKSNNVDSIIFYNPQFSKVKNAQKDTMYFMRNGIVINQQAVKPEDVDSIIFYNPQLPPVDTSIFTDPRDGNTYKFVKIGNQVWMAENMRYLPSVVGPGTGSSPFFYYYVLGYDGTDTSEAKATANYKTYGVLYNWNAAIYNACPSGWHLPLDAEWSTLIANNGGDGVAGGNLKEIDTLHWHSPNTGATNESGFTALPGGYRYSGGPFYGLDGHFGYWWCATAYFSDKAWYRSMHFNYVNVNRNYFSKDAGFSVRCVKN